MRSLPADLLEDVASRARHDGGEQGLIVGVRGQHQARNLGVAGPDLPADLDAASVGQPDVEDRHIGLQGGDLLQPQLRRGGLTHHLHVLFAFEQRLQSCPDQLVVVEDENANRHCHNLATAWTPSGATVVTAALRRPLFGHRRRPLP